MTDMTSDVLSAEAFAELLSGIQVYIGEHSVQEMEAAYTTLLARYTALEQQLREARTEAERLKLAIGNIPEGAAALLDGIRAAREVARHNPLHNQPFCPDCEALVQAGQP